MLGFGTTIVAGCTPGKGGEEVDGVPVYDTVADAVDAVGHVDISVDLRAGRPREGGGARSD